MHNKSETKHELTAQAIGFNTVAPFYTSRRPKIRSFLFIIARPLEVAGAIFIGIVLKSTGDHPIPTYFSFYLFRILLPVSY